MYSCLTEFNEEAFRKDIHDEGYNEDYDSGHDTGLSEGFNNAIIKCIQKSKAKNISIDDNITLVMEYFDLSKQEASALVKEYRK